MTNPSLNDSDRDWLDDMLVADANENASNYIADDGFTARVMNRVPAQALPRWRKPAVFTMWGVAAAGALVSFPEIAIDVGREAFRILATQSFTLPQIATALVAIGFASWGAAAYALRN